MKRAVLLTGHFPHQKRKASLLWVSSHLQNTGWHVTHATVGYSWLSSLRRDARLSTLPSPPVRGLQVVSSTLTTLYSTPPIHPFRARLKAANTWLEPFFDYFICHWKHRLRAPLTSADLVICESGPPILLAPVLARYARNAHRIYRVNDDIRLLNAAPSLVRAEATQMAHFTRISTASPVLAKRFAQHPNVTLDPMGIPHEELKETPPNPYTTSRLSAVCAGTTQIDLNKLADIASARPNWDIHLLGRLKSRPPRLRNLHWYGEKPFYETLGYIAHADVGLAAYVDAPGIEYQATNSNRILLYRHFGLPVLGPDRLTNSAMPGIIGYGDRDVWRRCETQRRNPEQIPDWSELAIRLTQNGETEPPNDVSTDPFNTVNPRVKTVPALASSA